MSAPPEVLVVGAGVVGLSTALLLASRDVRVEIWTRDNPDETTSCAAGALWSPYLVRDERVHRWAWRTYQELCRLAGLGGHTGVRLVHGLEASRRDVSPPSWVTGLPGFRPGDPHELPRGYASGWWFTAPIVDMPVFLGHLYERFTAVGGVLTPRRVESLDEATAAAPIVVNCTGFGSRELVPDASVTAIRGQVIVVENPGVAHFFADHDEASDLTYILPQGERVVLGGSAEAGRTDTVSDDGVGAAIHRRCAGVVPILREARVVASRVGLRPMRPQVRVEAAPSGADRTGPTVFHNYGHGGAGVSLAWGCAEEIGAMIAESLSAGRVAELS